MRNETRYVSHIPKKLPKGKVLVHNHVFPQRVLRANGFRAWTQTLDDALEVCSCGWAGLDLYGLVHYRVKKDSIQKSEKGTVKGYRLLERRVPKLLAEKPE